MMITTVLDEEIDAAFPKERLAVVRVTTNMNRNLRSENAKENTLSNKVLSIDRYF